MCIPASLYSGMAAFYINSILINLRALSLNWYWLCKQRNVFNFLCHSFNNEGMGNGRSSVTVYNKKFINKRLSCGIVKITCDERISLHFLTFQNKCHFWHLSLLSKQSKLTDGLHRTCKRPTFPTKCAIKYRYTFKCIINQVLSDKLCNNIELFLCD